VSKPVTKRALTRQISRSDTIRVPKKTERKLVADVELRLVERFSSLPPENISAAVLSAHTRFQDSSIRDFIPLLVERRVSAELAALS
jgi:hypothetical protein